MSSLRLNRLHYFDFRGSGKAPSEGQAGRGHDGRCGWSSGSLVGEEGLMMRERQGSRRGTERQTGNA